MRWLPTVALAVVGTTLPALGNDKIRAMMEASVSRQQESIAKVKTALSSALTAKDIYTGILKAFVFGIVIATVGCSEGLRAKGGAIGVGEATRKAVVVSYLLIIMLGYYLTYLFFRIRW
jgi:ABC-type transporter Mla maintaining outer membrane lipid asymmetry permease subunit MlaE